MTEQQWFSLIDIKPAKPPPHTSDSDSPAISRQTSRDHRDPYSDEQSLDQFVSAVERYVKQIETLTKPSLKGPTPLDKEWQVSTIKLHTLLEPMCITA